MSQAWMIASGKGGVGKSTLAAALGIALARRQLNAVAIDTDIGLRNLDLLLGLEGKVVFDVLDVARKECKLKYALIRDAKRPALSLLAASQMGSPAELTAESLSQMIEKLKKRFLYILIDSPPGLGDCVKTVMKCADQTLLITTADDVAIRDAERVLSLLAAESKPHPLLIVNHIQPELVYSGEMYSPQTVANLLDVPLLGYVPSDLSVLRAASRHESFMDLHCPARHAVERICRRFVGEHVPMANLEKKRGLFDRSL